MSIETRVVEQKGLKAVDVAVIAVLFAVGAVLRYFCPAFFGITPNFIIGMYCLAVLLLRPRLGAILGIGLVAGAICQMTTKSAIPFLNFISEPIGALAAGLLAMAPLQKGFLKYIRPFVVTVLATLASGFAYISIFKSAALFVTVTKNPALAYLSMVVIITAIANAILVSFLYFPLRSALGRSRD